MQTRRWIRGLVPILLSFVWLHSSAHAQQVQPAEVFENAVGTPRSLGRASLDARLPALPEGRQVYFVRSGHNSPRLTQAVVDPLDVHVGDVQLMRVSVGDTDHPIRSVTAAIQTDTGTQTHALALVEGTPDAGIWEGSWTVHDTHSATYRTTYTATNEADETSEVTLSWTDPCAPAPGGDWTLDGNCSISGVSGVDNGNLIIDDAAYTLTIQAGATFAWNPTRSITLSAGSIAINETGTLKQTLLWMTDADSDGFPANGTQFAQDAAPLDGRRRSLMLSTTTIDCDDGSGAVNPGSGVACNYDQSCAVPTDDAACGSISCSGWYEQTGTESPTDTETCFNRADITTNRCEGYADCKDANTADCAAQATNVSQYSCGTCQYIAADACTGTTRGGCTDHLAGVSCGANQVCDGAGSCVACDADGDLYTSLICGGDDCDDDCPTCYPGSTTTTTSPDSLDQDCANGADDIYDRSKTCNFAMNQKTNTNSTCASYCAGGVTDCDATGSVYTNMWFSDSWETCAKHFVALTFFTLCRNGGYEATCSCPPLYR